MPNSSQIPSYLIQAIGDGQVVLVLGAGASVGALHPKGCRPPVGSELGTLLSTKFLGGRFQNLPLASVSELAISESDLVAVQDYIAEVFLPFQPASFHKLLPTFKWAGLATLNYDLVMERAYAGKPLQTLRPMLSNSDRIEEIRRSPNDLMYLKLHGCITRTHEPALPLILTPDQYVTYRMNRGRLFGVLKDWACEYTLVFIGTSLQDPDLRIILLELAQEQASRARFYLVTPDTSDEFSRMWETKRISTLSFTFEGFLEELDRALPGLARAVPVPKPKLPVFEKFTTQSPSLGEECQLLLERHLVYVHPQLTSQQVDPKQFYRGFSSGWAAIAQNLDCPRELTDQILMEVILADDRDREADLVVIRAEAGGGKSVLLHRLAWQAACDLDALCLFGDSNAAPSLQAILEISQYLNTRLYLFIDNPADCAYPLLRLLEAARKQKAALTVIVAERSSEWHFACEVLLPFVSRDYSLRYLTAKETTHLIDLLEKYDSLGTLRGQPRALQEDAFSKRAGRQLLVALHEATLGRPFEEIVRDEYDHIVPEAAQSMYLTICLLNRTGTPVRAGLISRVHGITFEQFQQKFFKPLDHVVFASTERRSHDYEYQARHPHIAELVFQQVLADQNLRYEKYSRILVDLNIVYDTDRASFREMTNARVLMDLFSDHTLIQRLYEIATSIAPEEGHVYLQHAIYQMKHLSGSLEKASDLLTRAQELMPTNSFVIHSHAELEVRRAERATSPLVREKHLREARALVAPQLGKREAGAYSYHTAFKIEHMRLKGLLQSLEEEPEEAVTATIRNCESVLADGLQRYPNDEYLLSADAKLAETLDNDKRAMRSLERATSIAVDNVHIVGRLAQMYKDTGEIDKARTLLEKALDVRPYDKRLNFLLGRLLSETNADSLLIESCLRRSFSEGDNNLDAQFWYGRQLYINDKAEVAQRVFQKLAGTAMSPHMRFRHRGQWLKEDGTPRVFSGKCTILDAAYGYIQRDGLGDAVYFPRDGIYNPKHEELSRGVRVSFEMTFNFKGPVAINTRPEGM